jgi:hypothetical protein
MPKFLIANPCCAVNRTGSTPGSDEQPLRSRTLGDVAEPSREGTRGCVGQRPQPPRRTNRWRGNQVASLVVDRIKDRLKKRGDK